MYIYVYMRILYTQVKHTYMQIYKNISLCMCLYPFKQLLESYWKAPVVLARLN